MTRQAIEVYWRQIRTHDDLNMYFSDVMNYSLPIPAKTSNGLSGFFYLVNWLETPNTITPLVQFTGRIPECEILKIQSLQATLFPNLSREFVEDTPQKSISKSLYSDFYTALQDVLPVYAACQAPGNSARDYQAALYQLEPTFLYPFYHALNPEFFEWIDS